MSGGRDGSAAFVIDYARAGGGEERFFHAPIDEIGLVTEAEVMLPIASIPASLGVSHSLVAAEMQPAARIFALRAGEWSPLLAPEVDGIPLHVGVIGDHAIWEDWGEVPRLAHATFDTPPSVYFASDSAQVSGWATDGADLAWKQTYFDASGAWTRVELWTARYERDPSRLAPRLVTRIDSLTRGVVGGGLYAAQTPPSRPRGYEIYDLSGGRRRSYVPPPERPGSQEPLYIDSTMLLYRSGTSAEGAFLVRIDPRALPYDEE